MPLTFIQLGFLRFEPFVELISKFKTKSLDEKIDRFFKIIDEDGNGKLSYEEISNLVFTSLRGHRVLTDEDITFFQMLSDYFSRFIFDKVGVDLEKGITLLELRNILQRD